MQNQVWLRHPPRRPVYEAANNPLTEVSAMVFYRGLEHLIKDFYSACLILNRSLNCRASKCQCSLNIFIYFKEKSSSKGPNRGKDEEGPQSFQWEGLKPSEYVSVIRQGCSIKS